MDDLEHAVRSLLAAARQAVDPSHHERLDAATNRLEEPLRVAIAGKVKAGKSTLLNALVGDELAPTDAGECTRIVTWYQDGVTYRVEAHLPGGATEQIPFERVDGAIQPRLGHLDADSIDHLRVTWPAEWLQQTTLIDTPGIDSISTDVSARSHRFLDPSEDRATDADAVLYLMRHLHPNDIRFLEAFHDDDVAQGTPTNAIGVLSRADEVGDCELRALEVASRAAQSHAAQPKLRALCQTVVPVSGLLAQGAATLRQDHFDAFRTIAQSDRTDELLLSADRIVSSSHPVSQQQRGELMARFGLYGVRVAVDAIATQRVTTATQLADELTARSGIGELRHLLATRFGARARVLKARSALAVVRAAVGTSTDPAALELLRQIDRIRLNAHEFHEVVLLSRLRAGTIGASPTEQSLISGSIFVDIERALGGRGVQAHERLGLDPGAAPNAFATTAAERHQQLSVLRQHPLVGRDTAELLGGAIRSIEGLMARQAEGGGGADG